MLRSRRLSPTLLSLCVVGDSKEKAATTSPSKSSAAEGSPTVDSQFSCLAFAKVTACVHSSVCGCVMSSMRLWFVQRLRPKLRMWMIGLKAGRMRSLATLAVRIALLNNRQVSSVFHWSRRCLQRRSTSLRSLAPTCCGRSGPCVALGVRYEIPCSSHPVVSSDTRSPLNPTGGNA